MRLRQIAPVVLVLGLTLAGFLGARALGERDARRDSEHRADVAAAQIRARVDQGTALVESLRRFMVGAALGRVTSEQFEGITERWFTPAGFSAAAWVEQVPASRRAAYERRLGRPIVTRDERGRTAPVESRSSYLPATLVSGIPPTTVPGLDLSGETGLARAVSRARTLYDVSATPLATLRDGTKGLFLVESAQRLTNGVVEPGFVVLFVPELSLRAAAVESPTLQLVVGGASSGDLGGSATVRTFAAAGQRFEVRVPRRSVHGAAALLPWFIVAAGLVLAGLAGMLALNAARRGRAQRELDRIFNLSSDLIAIAGFDGYFRRVNPAVQSILGYTQEEFLALPYLERVHPDDRDRTAAEADAIARGKATSSFENRYLCRDGSYRWLEWTSTPVPEERLMYGVARDVTERRNAEWEVERLAEEQAALRRVATLVAQGVPSAELFSAVTKEVAHVFSDVDPVVVASVIRFDPGPESALVGASRAYEQEPLGARWVPKDLYVSTRVLRTGTSARVDVADLDTIGGPDADVLRLRGFLYQVGAPIIVEGSLWGAMCLNSKQELPGDTDERLEKFTALVATAIANAESREVVARLADEQAALRRVATLVARGASATEIVAVVAEEVGRFVSIDGARILRYESDGTATVIAGWSEAIAIPPELEVGSRLTLDGESIAALVLRTGRPARMDSYAGARGSIGLLMRQHGFRSSAGAPIVVDGRLWGVMAAVSSQAEPLPVGLESRIAEFTELVATAIANAESRAELSASRTRIVAASDEARRRIERDLHDGAQQRLVSLGLNLRLAESNVPPDLSEPRRVIGRVADELDRVIEELREIARGIHPALLSEGGLGPALRTLARRSGIPVELGSVIDDRLPEPIEVAAYYVISEVLTNATKHANASRVDIEAVVRDGSLRLSIRDDGEGGADPAGGSGLVGLRDRVEALGGSIEIISPPGQGTHVVVQLPVEVDLSVDEPEETLPARISAGR